jgi:hypothetical protein
MLLIAFLGLQVCAHAGGTPTVDQRSGKGANKQTLIATMFGEPLYLEQVTPANLEIKRKELPRGEFDEWLRKNRGRRTYENVWGAVMRRYVKREKLTVSEEELAAIAKSAERRLKSAPELPEGTALTPAERKESIAAWARGSLMDWRVCKSLYEKYGGRVGIGSLGAWTAFDGQNALLREHHQAGDIKFHHAEMEDAFWQHTNIENFADAYPKGERLKRLLTTPPYLRD